MRWFEDLYNRPIYLELYQEADTRLAAQEVDGIEAILQLKPGQTILDVCCGYGRHAIELARRGHQVVGIDLSTVQIAEGLRRVRETQVDVQFLVGDAREMPFRRSFDVTLNLFTSFGFFGEDAENLKMLQSISRATKPGGLFLMEGWNREKLIRDFKPLETEVREDGTRIEKRWGFDPWNGRVNWSNTATRPDGSTESWEHSIRAYTLVELRGMLHRAGFKLERIFGDYDGGAYTLDSPRLITIARKTEEF